jgi:hypothetical protein
LPVSCSPQVAPAREFTLDDFEDGDAELGGHDAHGFWYVNNDGTGTQEPSLREAGATPALVEPEGSPDSPDFTLFTRGEGFERWGAFVGARLNAARSRACTYDVSGSSGLRLNARGSGKLRVNLGTVETTPVVDGGSCTAEQCSDYGVVVELGDDWQRIEVPFEELTQPGWATPAAWKPEELLRLSFWTEQPESFEVWIDDVGFF